MLDDEILFKHLTEMVRRQDSMTDMSQDSMHDSICSLLTENGGDQRKETISEARSLPSDPVAGSVSTTVVVHALLTNTASNAHFIKQESMLPTCVHFACRQTEGLRKFQLKKKNPLKIDGCNVNI